MIFNIAGFESSISKKVLCSPSEGGSTIRDCLGDCFNRKDDVFDICWFNWMMSLIFVGSTG